VTLDKAARYIDPTKCTFCGDCAEVYPVSLPDEYIYVRNHIFYSSFRTLILDRIQAYYGIDCLPKTGCVAYGYNITMNARMCFSLKSTFPRYPHPKQAHIRGQVYYYRLGYNAIPRFNIHV